nr:MAG TPA: hypothetical protein [Caudoviricetes sp.]
MIPKLEKNVSVFNTEIVKRQLCSQAGYRGNEQNH